jgi:hypothetical protein
MIMRDWFATLRKPRATGATGATAGLIACDSSLSCIPNAAAQTGNRWATQATSLSADNSRPTVAPVAQEQERWATTDGSQETAENCEFLESVAQVAQVAQENDSAGTIVWDAEGWRVYFAERSSIAEYDGGLSRLEAETRAYECCAAQWMNLNPPPEIGPERCVECGEPMDENAALPFLTGDGGHIWMHDHCHDEWMKRRRAKAASALRCMGINPPGDGGLK